MSQKKNCDKRRVKDTKRLRYLRDKHKMKRDVKNDGKSIVTLRNEMIYKVKS